MVDLATIQNRLSAIPCPICKQSRFLVYPQAEQTYLENLHKVRCSHCAYIFHLGIPTKPIRATDPDMGHWLEGLSCPACHELGTKMDFRCTPSVRDSIYFVTCKTCRHPFHEKAPMEAYE